LLQFRQLFLEYPEVLLGLSVLYHLYYPEHLQFPEDQYFLFLQFVQLLLVVLYYPGAHLHLWHLFDLVYPLLQ
jgi:hypothetical protein